MTSVICFPFCRLATPRRSSHYATFSHVLQHGAFILPTLVCSYTLPGSLRCSFAILGNDVAINRRTRRRAPSPLMWSSRLTPEDESEQHRSRRNGEQCREEPVVDHFHPFSGQWSLMMSSDDLGRFMTRAVTMPPSVNAPRTSRATITLSITSLSKAEMHVATPRRCRYYAIFQAP